jgi:DNA/RNA endonuclease YhcR with UshA esterase domain
LSSTGYEQTMKTAILCLVTTLLCLGGEGQEAKTSAPAKIRATEAKDHVGAEKIVTGKIAEVNIAEKLVRLNFDKPFPNQPFTAVIFAAKTNLFPSLEKLKGKNVEVSGKIAEYRDRPQIVLVNTNQLKIIEAGEAKKQDENKK